MASLTAASLVGPGISADGMVHFGAEGLFSNDYVASETLNIAAYVADPCVVIAATVDPVNYKVDHDGGNASAGKLILTHAGNGAVVIDNTDASSIGFAIIVVGEPIIS